MTTPAPTSPCIGTCIIDQRTGFCRGCARTLAEIAGWLEFSAQEQRQILAALPDRRRL
ncbi:MAG: DUF1289 domain-containing protein, partial [Alphaproteobacteria bacterium]|nr:DUF1289 domain-containing protein [Alphaproteobacteria bacterium]